MTVPTYPNGLPYRPEVAIQLIADDARSIRPCDLDRLFDEEPQRYHEALLAFILASDASPRAKHEAKRIAEERQNATAKAAEDIMRDVFAGQQVSPEPARRKPSPAQTVMLRMMRAGDDFHVTGFWVRQERMILDRAIQLGWVKETEPGSDWYRITPAGLAALEVKL